MMTVPLEGNAADEQFCYICFASADAGPLERVCRCPTLVHRRCIARWCLYSAGRPEERSCRFCQSTMPDWKSVLTPRGLLLCATPVLSIYFGGTCVRLRVTPGRDGLASFLRQLEGLVGRDIAAVNFVFRCRCPDTGAEIFLQGLQAFEAAMHCACVRAAQRLMQQHAASAAGDASAAGHESAPQLDASGPLSIASSAHPDTSWDRPSEASSTLGGGTASNPQPAAGAGAVSGNAATGTQPCQNPGPMADGAGLHVAVPAVAGGPRSGLATTAPTAAAAAAQEAGLTLQPRAASFPPPIAAAAAAGMPAQLQLRPASDGVPAGSVAYVPPSRRWGMERPAAADNGDAVAVRASLPRGAAVLLSAAGWPSRLRKSISNSGRTGSSRSSSGSVTISSSSSGRTRSSSMSSSRSNSVNAKAPSAGLSPFKAIRSFFRSLSSSAATRGSEH